MAWTTTLTDSSSISNSIVLAFDKSFIVAWGQSNVMDQFVEYKEDIGAKSIQMPKFGRLAVVTSALTEDNDPASNALSDSAILFTPKEYGNVVTTTKLSNLQTGGKADLAAAKVVGLNWGQSMDKLALLSLDASSNTYIVGGTAFNSVTASNIANKTFMDYFYNKLARHSIPTIGTQYVAVLHDDVIADLRKDTTAGSWTDVSKYSKPDDVLKNEVGMYQGFRIVRDNQVTVAANTGSVYVYNCYFMGYNGLGKATSQPGRLTITGPFDKLGRFVNLGWYEVSTYGIVDTDAVWVGQCSASNEAAYS